jgi:hypothetical protein
MLLESLSRIAPETPFAIALVVGNRLLMPLDRVQYWRSRGGQDDDENVFS